MFGTCWAQWSEHLPSFIVGLGGLRLATGGCYLGLLARRVVARGGVTALDSSSPPSGLRFRHLAPSTSTSRHLGHGLDAHGLSNPSKELLNGSCFRQYSAAACHDRLIGAGAASILFGSYLQGALRNPSAASSQQPMLFLGMALAESMGIFALVMAFIILFVKVS